MDGAFCEIIAEMRRAAAPGQRRLDHPTARRLRDLTRALLAAKPDAEAEYRRFLSISRRSLPLDAEAACRWIGGKRIVVTGGTGCIGSLLMAELSTRAPAVLVSVSRGHTRQWPRMAGAQYLTCDVRDLAGLTRILEQVRPDLIFHVAAQRSPALAEVEVHRTVTTNVFGTRNVVTAADLAGVGQVVCASTGKALRPYTPDVYAASKRAAEWIVSGFAARGVARYSAARFTHVVDNSIIHDRLLEWSTGGVIRLHGADIVFYAQSALESAQLLLRAGLAASAGGLLMHTITDLGWPVSLLDVALGVLRRTGSASPMYFSGHDPGYESMPFPGLYDPATAGELSPLLNAFEAAHSVNVKSVDYFPLVFASDQEADKHLLALEETCEVTQDPDAVRAVLDELSWTLLDATLAAAPVAALDRAVAVTAPHRAGLSVEQERMLAAIERHARRGAAATAQPGMPLA